MTGTSTWNYPISSTNLTGGATYTVRSRGTDGVGNVQSSYGVVRVFIPDPNPHGATSHPEGISVADDGTIWGASVGDRTVWKWVSN